MTCDDVKKELALRLVGLGAPEKSGEVKAHAQTCSACAKRLEKVQGPKNRWPEAVPFRARLRRIVADH